MTINARNDNFIVVSKYHSIEDDLTVRNDLSWISL